MTLRKFAVFLFVFESLINTLAEAACCGNNSGKCDEPDWTTACKGQCCMNKLAAAKKCWDNPSVVKDGVHVKANGSMSSCCGVMPMSFQDSMHTVVLFKGWETIKEWQYALSCIACIIFGIISVAMKVFRLRVESRLGKKEDERKTVFLKGVPVIHNCYRMVEAFIIYSWDYLLMLIVMTFNVGLFLCVCAGLSLGFFCMGHRLRIKSKTNAQITEEFKGDPACCGA